MNEDKEKWFELQLSVVRWHLDAAVSASGERARTHIQKAREAHAQTCGSVAHAGLGKAVQERLEKECSELRARLDAASRS